MSKKPLKKLLVPVLTATLMLGSAATANANTVQCKVNNGGSVYKYSIVRKVSLNGNYKFNIKNFIQTSQNKNTQANSPNNNNGESNNQSKPPKQSETKPTPVQEETPKQEQKTPPVSQNTSNEKHSLTAAEIEMVEYVNQARKEAGLQPLAIDVDLSYVARVKSKDMQDNNYFSHNSPTYGTPFEMMKNFGIQYKSAAENIAINSSVIGAHNAFMNSEGHRNNILNPRLTHIGIGIQGRHYTQMFIQK